MTNFIYRPKPINYRTLNWYFKVFTPEECAKIIELYKAGKEVNSTVRGESESKSLFTVKPTVRKSKNVWLPWNNDSDWIFQRLYQVATQCNSAGYNFQLSGVTEDLQLTKYEAPGAEYKWHIDSGGGPASIRKLSLVVQLSDPAEYEGGEFQAFEEPDHLTAPKDQGAVIIFPSYQVHRVLPVTKGTRYSVVSWISGEPYR